MKLERLQQLKEYWIETLMSSWALDIRNTRTRWNPINIYFGFDQLSIRLDAFFLASQKFALNNDPIANDEYSEFEVQVSAVERAYAIS